MFNLEKRERFIIIFLIALLLAGLSIIFYQKFNPVTDVRIRAFEYEGTSGGIKKININESDLTALTRLPGVGKSLAGRIVEYRNKVGNFRSVEDIKKVKGIKENLFEKIKDSITIE